MEGNWWSSLLCIGSLCIGPGIIFALGVAVGQGRIRLPYKLVKVKKDDYAVED